MKNALLIFSIVFFLFGLYTFISHNWNDNSIPDVSLSDEMRSCILNPECQNSNGKLIIGFTLPPNWDDPHSRGKMVLQAVYEGEEDTYPLYK